MPRDRQKNLDMLHVISCREKDRSASSEVINVPHKARAIYLNNCMLMLLYKYNQTQNSVWLLYIPACLYILLKKI